MCTCHPCWRSQIAMSVCASDVGRWIRQAVPGANVLGRDQSACQLVALLYYLAIAFHPDAKQAWEASNTRVQGAGSVLLCNSAVSSTGIALASMPAILFDSNASEAWNARLPYNRPRWLAAASRWLAAELAGGVCAAAI